MSSSHGKKGAAAGPCQAERADPLGTDPLNRDLFNPETVASGDRITKEANTPMGQPKTPERDGADRIVPGAVLAATAGWDAFAQLQLARAIPADEAYREDLGRTGYYEEKLRALRLRQDPLELEPGQGGHRVASIEEQMAGLRQEATTLLKRGSSVPRSDRLIHLRQRAKEIGLPLRDTDLQRLLWDARRRANGAVEIVRPGDRLDLTPTRWGIEGLLMAGTSNLIVALPKLGKTNLVVAAIAAWHRRDQHFIGQRFHGPCPPVIIAGTDMPMCDWAAALRRYGLMGQEDSLPINGPIKGMFHAGAPIHLDQDGIDRLTEEVSEHPGCLLILDSYAKLVGPLGITELSAEYAGPLGDLQEAIAPFNVTLCVIHHSGKTATGGDAAALASRGTTALPAAVSQIIALSRFGNQGGQGQRPGERRVLVRTEGRGGEPLQLLVEQEEAGWRLHGDAGVALREEALLAAEEALTDRQGAVLELVRDRWGQDRLRTTAADVVAGTGITDPRIARRTLQQLEHRGLIAGAMETTPTGRVLQYTPANTGTGGHGDGDGTPPLPSLSELSELSEVSDPLTDTSPASLSPAGGKGEGTHRTERTHRTAKGGDGTPPVRPRRKATSVAPPPNAISTAEAASQLGVRLQTLRVWASRNGEGAERGGWRIWGQGRTGKGKAGWLWVPVTEELDSAA